MNLTDIKTALTNWKFTRYKATNFAIGTAALLLYEFAARPIYRPYIYRNDLYDFHLADTLGNTLGTMTTLFFLLGIFSNRYDSQGTYLIRIGTLSVVLFELTHPLLGKPIDVWDIFATLLTGIISHLLCTVLFRKSGNNPASV